MNVLRNSALVSAARLTAVLLSAALCLASAAPAQSPATVSPRRAASGYSDANNRYPFGQGSQEYQQVHSSWSFSNRSPRSLVGMRLTPTITTQPARVEIEMWMAESPLPAARASRTYADNERAGTRVQVVDRRWITLPANSSAFGFHIPFDRPFQWSGGHLSWRVRVHGNDLGVGSLQYAFAADRASSSSSRTGSFTGCAAPAASRAPTHDGVFRPAGETSSLYATSRVPNVAMSGLMLFGLSTTSTRAGLPLPFHLDPLGAAGCTLVNDVRAATPFTTAADRYGSVRLDLTIPGDPGLVGQRLYTQAAFLQPGANGLGLIFSPGATHVLPGRNGSSRIYGSVAGSAGGVENLFGLVVGFDGA